MTIETLAGKPKKILKEHAESLVIEQQQERKSKAEERQDIIREVFKQNGERRDVEDKGEIVACYSMPKRQLESLARAKDKMDWTTIRRITINTFMGFHTYIKGEVYWHCPRQEVD